MNTRNRWWFSWGTPMRNHKLATVVETYVQKGIKSGCDWLTFWANALKIKFPTLFQSYWQFLQVQKSTECSSFMSHKSSTESHHIKFCELMSSPYHLNLIARKKEHFFQKDIHIIKKAMEYSPKRIMVKWMNKGQWPLPNSLNQYSQDSTVNTKLVRWNWDVKPRFNKKCLILISWPWHGLKNSHTCHLRYHWCTSPWEKGNMSLVTHWLYHGEYHNNTCLFNTICDHS